MHYCATFYRTILFFFFFNDTATTEIYPLSLHDALPISSSRLRPSQMSRGRTSIWQRPATTWASFSRWIVPTWWASIPSLPTSKFRSSIFCMGSRKLGRRANCSISTSTIKCRAGMIRTYYKIRVSEPQICVLVGKVSRGCEMKYEGPRHFDAHAYRTEDYEGVKEFARGCMRTYLVFKEKSRRWNADKEIQALLKETSVSADGTPKLGRYPRKQADALLAHHFDRDAILKRKLPYERLDQLTVDILAGVRCPCATS